MLIAQSHGGQAREMAIDRDFQDEARAIRLRLKPRGSTFVYSLRREE
jgi:hypothetical protein